MAQSLDPHDAPEPAQLTISTWPVYDRLLQVSTENGYEPMLATEWEFSPDGKELTLRLREGVTFTDGTPFNAEAVKANLDNYIASEGTALQQNVADIEKVVAVSPYEVRLELKRPTTTVLAGLASTLGGIMISPKALGSPDLASQPVGTGAYVVESFQPGQSVTYTRRTDEGGIWDPQTGKPAKVTIEYAGKEASANALRSGQANLIVWSSDTKQFQSQMSSGELYYAKMDAALSMVGINFNPDFEPYDDPAVRRAVNYAINREEIVSAFLPNNEPRVQPWPEGLPGFDPAREDAYSYDPEKAKDLLAEAGYTGRVDGGEMLVATTGALGNAAEVIQSNLADVGIDIELRTVDIYTLIGEWAKGAAPVEFMYMSLPSINASEWMNRLFLNPVWSPAGPNAQVAKLTEGLDDPTLSDADREAQIDEAIDYATEQALYATVYQGVGGLMADKKVRGLDDIASVNGGIADLRNTYLVK